MTARLATRMAAALLLLAACKGNTKQTKHTKHTPQTTDPGEVRWLRGQLHAHTGNSMDSNTRPDRVVEWYAERGFDFLVLTDHNIVTEEEPVGDLLVLRGAEMTQNLERCDPPPAPGVMCLIHVTGLFLERGAPIEFPPPRDWSRTGLFRRGIDEARARGGIAMINHPNFRYAIDADGLVEMAHHGVALVEIWNQHPMVQNAGDADHPNTEALWDDVLTRGITLWGVATDDAHHYDDARAFAEATQQEPQIGNKGWVVVRARKQESSIREALVRGDFYSSTGVSLERVMRADGSLFVTVIDDGSGPYAIRFIGPGGSLLDETEGTEATHAVPEGGYVRAEVVDRRGRRAWTQPVR